MEERLERRENRRLAHVLTFCFSSVFYYWTSEVSIVHSDSSCLNAVLCPGTLGCLSIDAHVPD